MFFIGHIVHPYHHFLANQVLVMDGSPCKFTTYSNALLGFFWMNVVLGHRFLQPMPHCW